MPDDVVARLEALQKVEEVTEETQVEKNLPKMELMPPLKIYMLLIADGAMITWMYL